MCEWSVPAWQLPGRGASPVCISVGGEVRVPTDDQIFMEFHSDGHKTANPVVQPADKTAQTPADSGIQHGGGRRRRRRRCASWSLLTEWKSARLRRDCQGSGFGMYIWDAKRSSTFSAHAQEDVHVSHVPSTVREKGQVKSRVPVRQQASNLSLLVLYQVRPKERRMPFKENKTIKA